MKISGNVVKIILAMMPLVLLAACSSPININVNIDNGGGNGSGENSLVETGSITTGNLIGTGNETNENTNNAVEISDAVIELAILLDTSNSMDGLIEQTKSQLRQMVNEFGKARDEDGKMPLLKIALYQYGNDDLSITDGYVQQIMPFTKDLDMVSEALFSLTTNGGSEYCGEVIKKSIKDLDRSNADESLRIILIAGNEPFTQGSTDYHEAIADAVEKNIIVNTIFCGDYEEGIETKRKDGATLGNGEYFNIDQDKQVVYFDAPQDDRIEELNDLLNSTYIPYGDLGEERYQAQSEQDDNSVSLGISNLINRTITKTSRNYSNESWDLVDAVENSTISLDELSDDELPEVMQDMTEEEREAYIEENTELRKSIQEEISALSVERDIYISEQRKALNLDSDTLDQVIYSIIQDQLKLKNFSME